MIEQLIKKIGKKELIQALKWMIEIRHFETRSESAYQQGLIGGFLHSYAGQEAIQTSAVQVFGMKNWYVGFYRCHALALLLEASPNEVMAELYGKSTGIAKGRGGSMHLYADRLLGGFGIVGGHLPIAAGAAFSLKYLKKKDEMTICFLGEGATAQGAFHETLNLASLWNLPVVFVIENNHWGMGTAAERALAFHDKIAETVAPAYKMRGFTLDGMDYFNCYAGFEEIRGEVLKTSRPILVECICERFKGHSISDPGVYRTKESVHKILENDPITLLKKTLIQKGILTEEEYKKIDQEAKRIVLEAMKFAEESPWPSPALLEEDVYAP